MSAPVRIRLSRAKGWRLPANTIVVARPSPWGNPFKVGQDGNAAKCVWLYERALRGDVCLTTKATVADQIALRQHWLSFAPVLQGQNLACWCVLGRPCHVDVLLRSQAVPHESRRRELVKTGAEGARQGLQLADGAREAAAHDPQGPWAAIVEGHDRYLAKRRADD